MLKAARAFRDAGAPTLYLDGSFVTAKRDPSDYDCCYYAGHVDPDRIDPVLLDIDNAPAMKKAYKGEFYSALSEIKRPDFVGTFISFFRRDKDTHAQRGIVALDLASLP
ncbi:MAG: hypothetical protein DCF16_01685 [Alphaproteobacteria bacterium]|nr:MAG: hypothetical protein DCF16_01685 [Alphaproteobacteria bacterium]